MVRLPCTLRGGETVRGRRRAAQPTTRGGRRRGGCTQLARAGQPLFLRASGHGLVTTRRLRVRAPGPLRRGRAAGVVRGDGRALRAGARPGAVGGRLPVRDDFAGRGGVKKTAPGHTRRTPRPRLNLLWAL